MLVQQPSLESLPHHNLHDRSSRVSRRRKPLTPAISNLLTATTIPGSRNKHRQRLNSNSSILSKAHDDTFFSTPSSANSSSLLSSSSYSSRRSSANSSILSTSISHVPPFYIKSQRYTSINGSSSSSSTVKDVDIHNEYLTIDEFLSGAVSDCEDEEEEEDDDNDSCYSLNLNSPPKHDSHGPVSDQQASSTQHQLSTRSVSKYTLTRRASAALLRSNSSVKSHPLAVFDDGYDADDALTSCNEAPALKKKKGIKRMPAKGFKYQTFVSNLTASFKAISSVATSFSTSHQKFITSTDVFKFSPRSTDEPIPSRQAPIFIENSENSGASRKKIEARILSKNKLMKDKTEVLSPSPITTKPLSTTTKPTTASDKVEPQAESKVGQGAKEEDHETQVKNIPLQTYSVEEYALAPIPKGRDYRENSEFLRMYSLENRMRRNGKFGSTGASKAQVVLMPRKDEIPPKSSNASLCSLTTLSGKSCGDKKGSYICGCRTGNGPFSNTYKYLYSSNHGRVIQPCIHSSKSKEAMSSITMSTHIEGLDKLLGSLVDKLKANKDELSKPVTSRSVSSVVVCNPKPISTKVPQRWVPISVNDF